MGQGQNGRGAALRRRRMMAALAGALLLAGAAPALALMPPEVYERARREAPSVVVVEVSDVMAPTGGFGTCAVAGIVRKVERGAAYKVGQSVTIGVPCVEPGAQPPLGGTIYQVLPALKAAPFGRAYLNAEGALAVSQYEMLNRLP